MDVVCCRGCYGRLPRQGRVSCSRLRLSRLPFVSFLVAVSGDAAELVVLIQVHIADAAMFVVTVSDPLNVYQMVNTAQTLNPDIGIVIRSSNGDETALLKKDDLESCFTARKSSPET